MSNKTKSYEDKMTGSAKILANNFSFVILLALFVVSASAAAFGEVNISAHTATLTVMPAIVQGATNTTFIMNVKNDNTSINPIHEFRLYFNPEFSDYQCAVADGWFGPFVEENDIGQYCHWNAKSGNSIPPGSSRDFSFASITPATECGRDIRVETRDKIGNTSGEWLVTFTEIAVDKTPPTTDKHFEGPQIVVDNVEWIDGVSTVVLNATDSIGPHDTGVNKTEYRDTLVDYGFCYQPATCGNAQGTGNWQTYTTPFSLGQSCHLLEYRSIDGVGNVETAKKNCFFVDKTNPIAKATVGNPKLECSKNDPSGCAYWVQDHATEINLSCSNGIEEPHPSPLDKLQWRMGIDSPPTGDWNEIDASHVETVIFNEDSVHYLEYTCNDTVGKHDDIKTTIFRVDSVAPEITKEMFGSWLGDCPPAPNSNDECFVADNDQSGVNISVVDPDPTGQGCNVDQITCQYRIDWIHDGKTDTVEQGEFSDNKKIIFAEDSTHKLYINCSDALGNKVSDVETFLVDSTPPVTNKTYGLPFVAGWYPKNCNLKGISGIAAQNIQIPCGLADWINSSTSITLSASDNKVGVDTTYWRNLLVTNADAGEKICGMPEEFCNPDYYNKYVNLSTPWNEYSNPFQKPEESCHVIEYYSTDLLGNTEAAKWQCVFVDNTAPEVKKTIGEPKVVKNQTCNSSNNGPTLSAASKPRMGNIFTEGISMAGVGSGPCANATQPNQCAYLNISDLPNFVKDTVKAQLNISLDTPPPGCDNALILSSGNPANNGSTLSTNMGHPGCGKNPDGFATNDCVRLINYTIPEDVSILAVSSEWPEYYHTTFTDWMQVSNSISVDMSINNWKNVIELPQYGPDKSGTQTLASNVSKGSSVSLRVADSGDSIYDTAMILLPLACGEPVGPAEKCGDGILQEFLGEECDLGAENGQPGSGCSATCQIVVIPPNNCTGGDTYITQDTPITLTCKDALPHPVDHVSLWYRYRVSDDCTNWGSWTNWIDPIDPYLVNKTIFFPEDSCHELEYYCKDGLGNTGPVQSEIDIVDTAAPEITKEIVGPSYYNSSEEKMYLDGVTEIHVDATDPEPHPVNDVTCDWDYEVIGGDKMGKGQTGVSSPFVIHFPEESKHVLTIVCRDALNNTAEDTQTYYVDKTIPITTKQYGKPFYTNGISDWISSATNITLSVEDAGPHKSGINETKYRITLLDGNSYCQDVEACQQAEGTGDWKTYTEPFQIDEDSCHLMEYYSVDNVNKTEEVKKQCTFVENRPPVVNKTVGDPKELWDGKDANFYNISDKCWNGRSDSIDCWKITTLTPITLDCVSSSSHPVGKAMLAFNVNFDGSDMTKEQCGQVEGGVYNQSGDGFCIVENVPVTIYFNQTSEHNLKAYCTDAMLNKGPIDEEKFKVEGTSFNITINKKWNLISVPFVLLNDSMHKVFDPQADKIMSVWTYDAFAKKWYVFTPDGIGNDDMASMLPGWGYWVLAGNDTSLLIGGSLFSPAKTPPTKEVVSGWNLIGYWGTENQTGYYGPNGNGKDAYCELYSLGGNLLDKEFNSLWSYWEPYNPNEWIQFNKYAKMDPGAGYWLHTTQSDEYVVPTDCSVGPWH